MPLSQQVSYILNWQPTKFNNGSFTFPIEIILALNPQQQYIHYYVFE